MLKSLLSVAPRRPRGLLSTPHRLKSKKSVLNTINVYTGFIKQVEAECDNICKLPRTVYKKVTIFGAGTDVGRVIALFLKQPNVVETLTLFDWVEDNRVDLLARDLAHIDTATRVEAVEGWVNMKKAFADTEVLVLCSGISNCSLHSADCACASEEKQFYCNLSATRAAAIGCARFCPHAFVAVATPPVDSNFSLCSHVLESQGVLDKKRILGVNSVASMRANSLGSALSNTANPAKSYVPVVGGCGQKTAVPAFSADAKACYFPRTQMKHVIKLVRNADSIICNVKCGMGHAHLSTGFAIARCVRCIMSGLFEKPTFIDSALVWQDKPELAYGLAVCSTAVSVSCRGICEYHVPSLSDAEQELLESSRDHLLDNIRLGQAMATGEEYIPRLRCKIKIQE